MVYDADKIKIPVNLFKNKNMADVYIAIFSKNNNIRCTVIAHEEDFLKDYYRDNLSEMKCNLRFGKKTNLLLE